MASLQSTVPLSDTLVASTQMDQTPSIPTPKRRSWVKKLTSSTRNVFAKRNTVPVMNELWDLFQEVSSLIPVPGVAVAVGMVNKIKVQVEVNVNPPTDFIYGSVIPQLFRRKT